MIFLTLILLFVVSLSSAIKRATTWAVTAAFVTGVLLLSVTITGIIYHFSTTGYSSSAFLGHEESYELETVNDQGDYAIFTSNKLTVVIEDEQGLPETREFYDFDIVIDKDKAGTMVIGSYTALPPRFVVPWVGYPIKHPTIFLEDGQINYAR